MSDVAGIRRVVVVMAMRAEAEFVLANLNATKRTRGGPRLKGGGSLPFAWYDTSFAGIDVLIAVNGTDPVFGCDNVGTQPATLNTYLAVAEHEPDLVITAGTAGGFERHDTKIGDVFLSEKHFVFHDRRIPMPVFDDYGVGSYPAVPADRLAAELGYKTGIVSSSDSLDESEDDRRALLASGAKVKEMEAAAIAWVCSLLDVPLLAIKTITDLVDHPADTGEQFITNLEAATHQLASSVPAVLTAVAGRNTDQL